MENLIKQAIDLMAQGKVADARYVLEAAVDYHPRVKDSGRYDLWVSKHTPQEPEVA